MITLKSYVCDEWQAGSGAGTVLKHAVTGEEIATVGSRGLNFRKMLDYGREVGGPALRAMSFPRRAALLKEMAGVLGQHLPEFYEIAASYGATRFDAWMDIEGGIGTLAAYSSMARRRLPDSTFVVDGDVEGLSKGGTFVGQHIWVSLEGVAVQINAFNFPAWGMLEKLAPSLLAGLPSIVKPATSTCWLTNRMVELLTGSGVMPEGSLQLICGSVGDLLDHLTCQDVVAFTGSAETGEILKRHPNLIRSAVRVNLEADSINCAVLGPDVAADTATFDLFVQEVVREMTVKAGQKCTAVRRVMVPNFRKPAVLEALCGRLEKVVLGDPSVEGVRMGPLANLAQVQAARDGVAELAREAEIVSGDPERFEVVGAEKEKGAFFPPVLLHCPDPKNSPVVHRVEVFGPVATVMGYDDPDDAIALARLGGGSLVASAFSEDEEFVRRLTFGLAPFHGRLMVMNEAASKESTGHGTAMPQMVHGGPGRAGGGEELGGVRGVYRYMQRVALQGSPERLKALCAG